MIPTITISSKVDDGGGRAYLRQTPDGLSQRPFAARTPVIRTLEEEIGAWSRARVVNPKWIAGVMRHGYKGAFEIAATVDYMFAFSATTGAVRDHHFDAVYQAFVADDAVREFMEEKNPAALKEMAARLLEAQERGLWTARSNSAKFELEQLVEREHG